jgi:hypothetical protein
MILSVERAAISQSITGVGYALDGPGFESRQGQEIFLLSETSLGPTQIPSKWIGRFFPRVKRPGREFNDLLFRLMQRLRMSGAERLHPLYSFTARTSPLPQRKQQVLPSTVLTGWSL